MQRCHKLRSCNKCTATLSSRISSRMSLLAYSYSNIDTSSADRRDPSRGNFRTLRGIVESPDDNGARGRRWRSSCSLKVFRNRRGASSTGRGPLSHPLYWWRSNCGDSRFDLLHNFRRKRAVETHCRSLMREKPLFESSAVVTIKSRFLRGLTKSPGDLRAWFREAD